MNLYVCACVCATEREREREAKSEWGISQRFLCHFSTFVPEAFQKYFWNQQTQILDKNCNKSCKLQWATTFLVNFIKSCKKLLWVTNHDCWIHLCRIFKSRCVRPTLQRFLSLDVWDPNCSLPAEPLLCLKIQSFELDKPLNYELHDHCTKLNLFLS